MRRCLASLGLPPAGLSLLVLCAFGTTTLVLLVAAPGYEAAATGSSQHHLDILSRRAARTAARTALRDEQRSEVVSAAVGTTAPIAPYSPPAGTTAPIAPYSPPPAPTPAVATFYPERGCKGQGTEVRTTGTALGWCSDKGPLLPTGEKFEGNVKSVRVSGTAELELFESCGAEESRYWAHVVPSDGCAPIYAWPPTRGSILRARISPGLATRQSPVAWPPKLDAPSAARAWADGIRAEGKTPYRVVFSAESSTYQTTQTRCNRLAFERSGQHADGGRWTRLLTMNSADDVSTPFPTFWAPRHPYSRRYGPLNKVSFCYVYRCYDMLCESSSQFDSLPRTHLFLDRFPTVRTARTLNKPDVIVKWYASASAPVAGADDVIVVIDPDNWLARSLQPWVAQVSVGHAVGQAAWFVSAKRQVQVCFYVPLHFKMNSANDFDLPPSYINI